MKDYNEYMNQIEVSEALHEKIMQPKQNNQRSAMRYAALAAGLVIVAGGVFALHNMRNARRLDEIFYAVPEVEYDAWDHRAGGGGMVAEPPQLERPAPNPPPDRQFNLPPNYSQLEMTLWRGMPLAVITVLNEGVRSDGFVSQRAYAEQILLQGTELVQLPLGEFQLNTGLTQTPPPGRYLAFIWGNEREFSFLASTAAKIDDDGAIVPFAGELGEENVFAPMAGMTIEEILAMLS